ncbi:MAG: hypothetical protein WEB37_09045 [Bacteroidota bacterium]
MLTSKRLLVVIVLTGSVFTGCSKKSTEPTETQPKFPTFALTAPAQATDTCGGPAYAYVSSIKSLLQSASILGLLPGQNINGVWTSQFPLNGTTLTLTSQRQSNDSIQWLLLWNGTDTSSQQTYSDWKLLEGNSSSDGKSGALTIYDDSDPSSQTPSMNISWQTLSSGATEATIDNFSGGTADTRIILIANPNGSGEITESMWSGSAWVETGYHATWTGEGATAVCT